MLLFFACLAATYVAVVALERFIQPAAGTPRPLLHRMSLLTAMPAMVFYLTVFMISYRPVFSLAATLIVYVAIIVLNNAKYAALREPLVFADFALLRQAIEHPALYVKYIGVFNIVLVLTGGALAIALGLAFEPPLVVRDSPSAYFPTAIYLFVLVGAIYACVRGPFRSAMRDLLLRFGPTTDVARDKDQLSLIVCLIVYFFLANEPEHPESRRRRQAAKRREARYIRGALRPSQAHPRFRDGPMPDVVAVQSESFFDARRLSGAIDPKVLANFDRLASRASYSGRLQVPAFGANTMRTEFAFLSGLPNEALGVHRFNPYLQLCKAPVWTIAAQLRAMGYRTVCIHPFASSFFDRDEVYPNLGFDAFLDIDSFPDAERNGPYISDRAVAGKIEAVLGESDQPQFIFAITMENHGKWETDRLAGRAEPVDLSNPPLGSVELGLYLHHLRNADAMLGQIARALKARQGDGVLCLFGDHVPSLPDLYKRVGFEDTRTDYLVWKKHGAHPRRIDVGADTLGRLVLDTVLNEANHAPIDRAVSPAG
jgi:hypothetical protein